MHNIMCQGLICYYDSGKFWDETTDSLDKLFG